MQWHYLNIHAFLNEATRGQNVKKHNTFDNCILLYRHFVFDIIFRYKCNVFIANDNLGCVHA